MLASGKRLDLCRLGQAFDTTHTTSIPGAPLAGIDGCRALLQNRGNALLGQLLTNISDFRTRVEACFDRPLFLKPSDFGGNTRFDPTKIVLRANQLGVNGFDIETELIRNKVPLNTKC